MCIQSPEGTNLNTGATSGVRLCARAVARLCKPEDGSLAGYLYEWNTGEFEEAWFGKPLVEYKIKPFDPSR